ncbi:MAG: patatin-like phospholipase family protein, partial [Flavobacteriales bacterium]|nr:patatin-like phospholipase family protein [Flavobacteriales bacterium]
TMALMLVSAIFSWVKGWTITIFLVIFLTVNYSYSDLGIINVPNHAYGLDYTTEPTDYDPRKVYGNMDVDSLMQEDFSHMLEILDNWRKKHATKAVITGKKPKLVIINASGGGSRAAMWTMNSLLAADSALNGDLMEHAFLVTGSSGGMIGAAYIRELLYQSKRDSTINPYSEVYCDNIGKDLLNPVIFSIATNDFFIRYQKFQEGENIYTKDRGYSFEKQLNENTHQTLSKRLIDYAPSFAPKYP